MNVVTKLWNNVLNKVKMGATVAFLIMALRTVAPDVEIPEGLQDAIMLIVVFLSQFFTSETQATVSNLKVKGDK